MQSGQTEKSNQVNIWCLSSFPFQINQIFYFQAGLEGTQWTGCSWRTISRSSGNVSDSHHILLALHVLPDALSEVEIRALCRSHFQDSSFLFRLKWFLMVGVTILPQNNLWPIRRLADGITWVSACVFCIWEIVMTTATNLQETLLYSGAHEKLP